MLPKLSASLSMWGELLCPDQNAFFTTEQGANPSKDELKGCEHCHAKLHESHLSLMSSIPQSSVVPWAYFIEFLHDRRVCSTFLSGKENTQCPANLCIEKKMDAVLKIKIDLHSPNSRYLARNFGSAKLLLYYGGDCLEVPIREMHSAQVCGSRHQLFCE